MHVTINNGIYSCYQQGVKIIGCGVMSHAVTKLYKLFALSQIFS